jgi:hypothetical protein
MRDTGQRHDDGHTAGAGTRGARWAAVFVLVAATVGAAPAVGQQDARIDGACTAEAQGFDPFADTSPGTHHAAINCAAYLGITIGSGGTGAVSYDPSGDVTREQMASFVARAMNRVEGFQLETSPPRAFDDSRGEHARNIDRLAVAGVVEGVGDGEYDRQSTVTREQMASYVARALETVLDTTLPAADDPFGDDIASAHAGNVAKLAEIGVVEGVSDGVYAPGSDVSRQEMASFLARGLSHVADQGISVIPETPQFPQTIGSFATPLTPGESRNRNIQLAAGAIDGQVIEPGETFSLDEAIGPRTADRGFVPNGYIDSSGDLVSVVGGGISQLATTVFNAAWYAGVELVDHQPHSRYFERYPAGRESTISAGTIDVVFTNDTPFPVTVTTSASETEVEVALIGTPWASVEDAKDLPAGVTEGDAFTVSYRRTVTFPDGTTSTDDHEHTYQAAP